MTYSGPYYRCLWCQDPQQAAPLLDSLCDKQEPEWLPCMLEDLGSCFDCVIEYQRAKERLLEFRPENSLKQLFYEFDVKRIETYLENQLRRSEEATYDVIDVDGYVTMADRLRAPLLECLKYPNYLMDSSVNNLFVQSFQLHSERNEDLDVDEKMPGVYLLLVHPHHQVRRWAMKTVRSLGSVSINDFDDLQLVSKWLFSVLEFGLFSQDTDIMFDNSIQPWDPDSTLVIPCHLFDPTSPHDFWVGVCMFLTALDAQTMRTQLTSGHQQIVDTIITVFEGNHDIVVDNPDGPSAFWPALQCFVLLLQRTEFRLWSVSYSNPNDVLNLIIYNRHYQAELLAMASLDTEEDEDRGEIVLDNEDDMSNSQIAYGWDGQSAQCQPQWKPQSRSFHATLFGWFAAFMLSLVDFGDLAADQFKYIVRFLVRLPIRLRVNSSRCKGVLPLLTLRCVETLIHLLEELTYRKLNRLVVHTAPEWLPVLLSHAQVEQPCEGFCDAVQVPLHELPSLCRLARKMLLFLIKSAPEGSMKKSILKYIPSLCTERNIFCSDERVVTIHSLSNEETAQFVVLLEKLVQESSKKLVGHFDVKSPRVNWEEFKANTGDEAVQSPLLFDEPSKSESKEINIEQKDEPVCTEKFLFCKSVGMHAVEPKDWLKESRFPPLNVSNASSVKISENREALQATVMKSIEGDKKYSLLSDTSDVDDDDDDDDDDDEALQATVMKSIEGDKKYSLLSDTSDVDDDDDDDDDDDVPLMRKTPDVLSKSGVKEKGGNLEKTSMPSKQLAVAKRASHSSITDSNDLPASQKRIPQQSCHAIHSSDQSDDSSDREIWNQLDKKEGSKKQKVIVEISDSSDTEDDCSQKTPNVDNKYDPSVTSPNTPIVLGRRPVLCLTPIAPFKVKRATQPVVNPGGTSKHEPENKAAVPVLDGTTSNVRDRQSETDSGPKLIEKLVTKQVKFQMPSTKSIFDRRSSKVRRTSSDRPSQMFPVVGSNMKSTDDDSNVERMSEVTMASKSVGDSLYEHEDKKDKLPADDYNVEDYLLDDNDQDIMMFFYEWDHNNPVTPDTVDRVDPMSCVEADLTQQVQNTLSSSSVRKYNSVQTDALLEQKSTAEKTDMKIDQPKQPEFKVPAVPQATRPTLGKLKTFPPCTRTTETLAPLPKRPASMQVLTKPQRLLTIDDLLLEILSWDPNYITQYGKETGSNLVKPPCHLARAMQVGEIFSSFQMYVDVFKPLLCLEVWSMVTTGLNAKQSTKPTFEAVVTNVHQAADQAISLMRCEGEISFTDNKEWNHLVEGDIVLVNIVKSQLRPVNCPPILGVVESINKLSSLDVASMSQSSQLDEVNLTVTLKVKQFRWMPRVKESVDLVVVASLVPATRQWVGLSVAHKNLLVKDVLFPCHQHFCSEEAAIESELTVQNSMDHKVFNESQCRAIVAATVSSLKEFCIPRICLLQGPPGTGKTHTVIGLLKAILQGARQNHVSSGVHILLCAPSNAAVDVLVRRLIQEVKVCSAGSRVGNPIDRSVSQEIQIVRVGRVSAIHPDVKPFSLNSLIDQRISQEAASLQNQAMTSLGVELSNIESHLEEVEKKIMSVRRSGACNGQHQVHAHLSHLETQKDELLFRRSQAKRQHQQVRGRVKDLQRQRNRIMKDILLGADVVCCTLSGSGSHSLSNIMKNRRGASALPHFSCVIVDEAAQCCELDILVPLQYGSSKLILVGDPEQLPATVLSMKAESLGYGRSMFERFYSLFQRTMEKSPVLMLDTQYRMHPAICRFPSKRFYNNRLKSCRTLEETKGWMFRPWLVYNMVRGEEECTAQGAFKNSVEAAMVVELCTLISKSVSGSNIGVITPYNHQRLLICKTMKQKLGQRLASEIEVNTVDGFQGREKDVILLSCVRARHRTGAIGFLSHRQRLNVSLTRAKKTLVVIGHLESLKVNAEWKALCDDAAERQTIVDVNGTDHSIAAKALLLSGKQNTCKRPVKQPLSTSVVSSIERAPEEQGLTLIPLSQPSKVNKAKQTEKSVLSGRKTSDTLNTVKPKSHEMTGVERQPVKDHSVNVTSVQGQSGNGVAVSKAKKPESAADRRRNANIMADSKEQEADSRAHGQSNTSSVSAVMPPVSVSQEMLTERISSRTLSLRTPPMVEPEKDTTHASLSSRKPSLSLSVNSNKHSGNPTASRSISEKGSETVQGAVSFHTKTGKPEQQSHSSASKVEATRQPVKVSSTAHQSEKPRLDVVRESTSEGWISRRSKQYNLSKIPKNSHSNKRSPTTESSRKRPLSNVGPSMQPPKHKVSGTIESAKAHKVTYEDLGYRVLLKPRDRVAHAGAATEARRKTLVHSNYYRKHSKTDTAVGYSKGQAGSKQSSTSEVKTSTKTTKQSIDLLGVIMNDMGKHPRYG